jgi:hypothetical protein
MKEISKKWFEFERQDLKDAEILLKKPILQRMCLALSSSNRKNIKGDNY